MFGRVLKKFLKLSLLTKTWCGHGRVQPGPPFDDDMPLSANGSQWKATVIGTAG
jgi:hypothetical protein